MDAAETVQTRGPLQPTAQATRPRTRTYSLHGSASPIPPGGTADPRTTRVARAHRGAGLVLIVDDSLSAREMYGEYLNHRGFWTVTAPDGEASIAVAFNLRPDVIVMDLAMPRMDGVSAIRRLKQIRRTRGIPVILLTGHALEAIERGALEAGAVVFLMKPCLPEELERQIKQVLH